jgi:putative tricarboxylic transport membrane protein
MDILSELAFGLNLMLNPTNLMACIAGAVFGLVAASLPGLSPASALALALPITFSFPAVAALVFLITIAVGTQYGRVFAALGALQLGADDAGRLISVGLTTLGGGVVAIVLVMVLAPFAIGLARNFGSAEYAALMIFLLVAAAALARGSVVRSLAVMAAGLLLGAVGIDPATGAQRLTFGMPQLLDGIGLIPLALGLFVAADVVRGLQAAGVERAPIVADRSPAKGLVTATGLGIISGIVPAGDSALTEAASDRPEDAPTDPLDPAGQPSAEQVAAAGAAGNARFGGSFLSLFVLGLPTNAVAVLLMAALLIHGVRPGPLFASEYRNLFFGLPVGIVIANVAMLAIALAMRRMIGGLPRVDYRMLAPVILAYCCLASFAFSRTVFDVYVMIGFAVLGYVLTRSECERGLFVMAFLLAPLLEENIRRTLLVAKYDLSNIVSRPIVTAILVIGVAVLFFGLYRRRQPATQ